MLKFNEEITVVDTITKLPIKVVMKVDSEHFIKSLKRAVVEAEKHNEFFDVLGETTRTDDIQESLKKAIENMGDAEKALLDAQGELSKENLAKHMENLARKQNKKFRKNTFRVVVSIDNMANYVTDFTNQWYVPTVELKAVSENEVHIIQNIRSYT